MPAQESGPEPDSTVQPDIPIHPDIAGKKPRFTDLGCLDHATAHSHDISEHAAFTIPTLPIFAWDDD
jgi:hypothetical protein